MATPRQMAPHHAKSGAAREKIQTHSGARTPSTTEPSTLSGDTVAQVQREMRSKTLQDFLVGMFGEPTYFRILAVALSWLGQCSCVPTMNVNVCAAALVLTGINFEGAAPLRPCVPILRLADYFQVRRAEIVQNMATLRSSYKGEH